MGDTDSARDWRVFLLEARDRLGVPRTQGPSAPHCPQCGAGRPKFRGAAVRHHYPSLYRDAAIYVYSCRACSLAWFHWMR